MQRDRSSKRRAALAGAMLAIGTFATAPTRAGDADHEITDDHENGTPYFGEVKDIAGLKPLASARVKAQINGTMRFLIGQTDTDGQFKIRGLGPEVDPDTVSVTCELAGYRSVDTVRRRLSTAADAPVEIECLMEKVAKAKPSP